jgi:hypothetical protein
MKCCQEIIRNACCKSRNAIGSRGSNEEEIDRLCDEDVIECAFEITAGVGTFE